jgi:hypothetical protein
VSQVSVSRLRQAGRLRGKETPLGWLYRPASVDRLARELNEKRETAKERA